LKIFHVHWGFPPIIGGVETHLMFLLPEQVTMGNEVSLLTGSAEGSPEEFDFHGAKIYRSRYFNLNWLVRSGFQEVDERLEETIDECLDKVKPDIVHAHNMNYFSHYHVRLLEESCAKRKIPMVLTAHNSWPDKMFLDLSCKVNWSKIISISHYIERELLAIGIPEEKIVTIHHGTDSRLFSPKPPSPKIFDRHQILKGKKNIIFNPARMSMDKGCDIIIEAFRLVKEKFPDAFLIMAGSKKVIDWGLVQNKEIAFFMSLIKHLGLEKSVYISHFSIDDEIPELYRISDLVVYPSTAEEPFGLATLESMSSGKPIIVTDSGGMPEIIHSDVNGYVIPKRNHQILAEKTINLLLSKELRDRLGNKGRELVKEKYTKEIYTRRVLEVYKDLLAGKYIPKEKEGAKKRIPTITPTGEIV